MNERKDVKIKLNRDIKIQEASSLLPFTRLEVIFLKSGSNPRPTVLPRSAVKTHLGMVGPGIILIL